MYRYLLKKNLLRKNYLLKRITLNKTFVFLSRFMNIKVNKVKKEKKGWGKQIFLNEIK